MDFRFMDRHALQSKARDDRETSKATNPKHITQVFKTTRRILGFLMDFARCAVASKEIRLCAYRRSETQTRAKGAKRQNPKTKGGEL